MVIGNYTLYLVGIKCIGGENGKKGNII